MTRETLEGCGCGGRRLIAADVTGGTAVGARRGPRRLRGSVPFRAVGWTSCQESLSSQPERRFSFSEPGWWRAGPLIWQEDFGHGRQG